MSEGGGRSAAWPLAILALIAGAGVLFVATFPPPAGERPISKPVDGGAKPGETVRIDAGIPTYDVGPWAEGLEHADSVLPAFAATPSPCRSCEGSNLIECNNEGLQCPAHDVLLARGQRLAAEGQDTRAIIVGLASGGPWYSAATIAPTGQTGEGPIPVEVWLDDSSASSAALEVVQRMDTADVTIRVFGGSPPEDWVEQAATAEERQAVLDERGIETLPMVMVDGFDLGAIPSEQALKRFVGRAMLDRAQ